MRKRAVALHPPSTGAVAAFLLEKMLNTFRLLGSRGKCRTWLCSPLPHPMPSCMAHGSPIHSLPEGEEVQVHPSLSCRNDRNKSASWWCTAGFCGSSWTSRSCALSLFVYPRKGLCRLLRECKFINLPFLTKKRPPSPVLKLAFFVKIQCRSQI